MKRRSNGRLNPAMKFGQLVERRNGPFIREDEGKGATFGGVGGLALCAGLGLGHDLEVVRWVVAEHFSFVGADRHRVERAVAGLLEESAARVNAGQAVNLREGVASRREHGLENHAARANWRQDALRLDGLGFGGRVAVHGLLRSVTVGGSSHITSDGSTTVGRVTM